jgi:hypothetical protein
MGDKTDLSVIGPTGLGLHLTINPRKEPKVKARVDGGADIPDDDINVRELYLQHGLTLGDKELRALRLSRPQGIHAIDTMLGHLPGFADLGKERRLNLAMKAADYLLEKSIEAKLSREVPTALDANEQAAEHLNTIFQNLRGKDVKTGSPPSLIESVPVGVSLTVHFSADWLDGRAR